MTQPQETDDLLEKKPSSAENICSRCGEKLDAAHFDLLAAQLQAFGITPGDFALARQAKNVATALRSRAASSGEPR